MARTPRMLRAPPARDDSMTNRRAPDTHCPTSASRSSERTQTVPSSAYWAPTTPWVARSMSTKFSNDKLFHSERVTAIHNQAAPGGWITAGTKSVATAHPQIYNGYVQAYDRSTKSVRPGYQ